MTDTKQKQTANQTEATQTNQNKAKRKFLYSQPDNAVICDLRLPKTAFHMYTILVKMMDKNTREVTAYVATLAKQIGRSIKTARRVLGILAAFGIIGRKFRKSHHNSKMNLATTYIIYGRFAECYKGTEYGEPEYISPDHETMNNDANNVKDPKMSVPTPKNGDTEDTRTSLSKDYLESNLTGEKKFSENSDNSLEHEVPVTATAPNNTEKPEKQKTSIKAEKHDLLGLPEAMRSVAEYLLMKTNRPTLRDSEREILKELDKHHTIARLLKEIDKHCKIFENEGRDIQQLTFNYIGKILANQDSRHSATKATSGNASGEISAPENDSAQETLPDIAAPIMPVKEAERVISEYTPTVKEQEEIPAALEELYAKIDAIEQEKTVAFTDSLPKTEDGWPDWDKAEIDEEGYPKIPHITMDEYLRLKFPEAEEEELRTDRVQDKRGLEEALKIDRTCAMCCSCNGWCPLTNKRELPKSGRPIVTLKNHKLEVRYATCIRCKHDKCKPDPKFESYIKRSGLSASQSKQTFTNYTHEGMPEDIVSAKAKAILAAKNGTSLILAGKAGTGKSHLAAAIAIEVMRGGKQALFISMPELLNEMRKSYQNHEFFNARQKFYDVPCLVLDDLGKEKATEKGIEYLFQIIDYRYRHGMQTIVTTNAMNMVGLVNSLNAKAVEPLVSRIVENGEWITIRNAKNYRFAKPLEPRNSVVEPEVQPEIRIEPIPHTADIPAHEPETETKPVEKSDFASALGMRESFDNESNITSSPRQKNESESDGWGSDPYEQEVIERDRQIAEFWASYVQKCREEEGAKRAKAQAESSVNVQTEQTIFETTESQAEITSDTPEETADTATQDINNVDYWDGWEEEYREIQEMKKQMSEGSGDDDSL